ncbi:MAG: hypothetical protein ABI557_07725, partial [Aureliella sp.]
GQGSGVPSSFLVELPRGELDVVDHCDRFDDFADADGGFDDYHDPSSDADWDEANQLDSSHDDGPSYGDFDDSCQLPPEEMAARLGRKPKPAAFPGIRSGLDFIDHDSHHTDPWAEYRPGCTVLHQKYGQGEIVSASGHGPKRSVTIQFFDDNSQHTFRLSHVPLEIQR